MVLAASLAAAVALGGIAVWQHSRAEDARAGIARAEERARGYGTAFADVLTAPDAALHSERLDDGTAVAVVVSRDRNRAAFTASGLPALTADRVYELWYAAAAATCGPPACSPAPGRRRPACSKAPSATRSPSASPSNPRAVPGSPPPNPWASSPSTRETRETREPGRRPARRSRPAPSRPVPSRPRNRAHLTRRTCRYADVRS